MASSRSAQDDVGHLRLGHHVCHFFGSAEDLGEILVPYFKAGLERNESCLWVTSSPYASDRAFCEMRAAMPDFDRRATAGQIQIFGHDEWYTKQGVLNSAETIQDWLSRKDEAVASGYAGLRISGNTSFLNEGMWNDFMDYEQSFNATLEDQPILALCSYCMAKRSAGAVFDVMHAHRLCLTKRLGHWDTFEIKSDRRVLPAASDPLATTRSQWSGLRDIVEDRLAGFMMAYPERIALEGDNVQLSSWQANHLAIVFHELAINATKHGVLSSPKGKLTVQWRLAVNGSHRLLIKWAETGMSNLTIPDKIGFGTRLIARMVENCVRVFEPTGMTCTFELNLESAEIELP